MIVITRLSPPNARGSVHALGWLALAVNAFSLPLAPMFKVALCDATCRPHHLWSGQVQGRW
jgi:P2-related tail formation protein